MPKPNTDFAVEQLVERDALGPGIDLYDRAHGKLYRCRFCHLGFSPAVNPKAQDKARTHVTTSHHERLVELVKELEA
jgi:hypothetical protein